MGRKRCTAYPARALTAEKAAMRSDYEAFLREGHPLAQAIALQERSASELERHSARKRRNRARAKTARAARRKGRRA